MRRRRFIASLVTATGAGIVPQALSPLAVAAPDRLNGSTTITTAIRDIAGDIWRTGADYVDPRSAPARADLLDVALWQWGQACVAANRARRRPYLHRQALTVEAEAARQLGMIYADRRSYRHAHRFYNLGAAAAERAGNYELAATIRTGQAYMPLYNQDYRTVLGNVRVALETLQQADRPGGRAAVCSYALLARSYAALGDANNTAEALRAAYGAMARYNDAGSPTLPAPHHPQRFAWVKLRLATAEAYAALGDTRRHEKAYESALGDPSVSQMHKPMLAMGHAELTTDPAAAAAQALTVLRRYTNPPNPIVGRARAVAARASRRAPHNDTVQTLRIALLKLPH